MSNSGAGRLTSAVSDDNKSGMPQLLVDVEGVGERRFDVSTTPYRVGRARANQLSYPENGALSREHFVLDQGPGGWYVQDLNSRNGTLLNGSRICGKVPLSDRDVIVAGHLSFTFFNSGPDGTDRILVVPDTILNFGQTRSTDLSSALASESQAKNAATQRDHLRAFVRAGRELVSKRSMDELFEVILDIAVDAAGASRGVVAVQQGDALEIRAQRGTGFQLSTAIVDQLLLEKKSLLVVDIAGDAKLASRQSIVAGHVKSFVAVPLQTDHQIIGLLYVDTPSRVFTFTADDLNLLTVLANVAAIRIEHARLLEIEEQEKLWAHDRTQAAEIQRSLLPGAPPVVKGFEFAGYNAASRSVGGDYYDFLPLQDGSVAVVVADVAGKGMPAALLMSSLQARVHVLFESSNDLAGHVRKLNQSLASRFPGNRFVTFFVAAFTPAAGELRFCNAGHNPPLLLHANGEAERLSATGSVLGISPSFDYDNGTSVMGEGDLLALYSDGVTEACHPVREEEFGEERLLQVLLAQRDTPAAAIIQSVVDEILQFTGNAPLSDDLTLVVIRRSGGMEG